MNKDRMRNIINNVNSDEEMTSLLEERWGVKVNFDPNGCNALEFKARYGLYFIAFDYFINLLKDNASCVTISLSDRDMDWNFTITSKAGELEFKYGFEDYSISIRKAGESFYTTYKDVYSNQLSENSVFEIESLNETLSNGYTICFNTYAFSVTTIYNERCKKIFQVWAEEKVELNSANYLKAKKLYEQYPEVSFDNFEEVSKAFNSLFKFSSYYTFSSEKFYCVYRNKKLMSFRWENGDKAYKYEGEDSFYVSWPSNTKIHVKGDFISFEGSQKTMSEDTAAMQNEILSIYSEHSTLNID